MPPQLTLPLGAATAAATVVAGVRVQPALRMPLADALGHVLAEDVHAQVALPPWTNASMDGYAVRAEDVRGARREEPVRLRVVAAIAAGGTPAGRLGAGEAVRIFTGAPVPDGADSVVRQEDTDRGAEAVQVHDDRDAGANVRRAGGDLALGALALAAGTELRGHQLALLAALAVGAPVVHRKPRVGILVTGDELVSLARPEQILAGERLADVNGPALAALVQEAGGMPVALGIVRDDPTAIADAIRAAGDVDLMLTAGGVSVGDHDHLHGVMRSLGVSESFRRVKIRPGGPTTFGLLPDGRPWLGLPGNPVSAMVTFELFARPAIRAMAGHREPFRAMTPVILDDAAPRDATLDQYLRVVFSTDGDGVMPRARLTGAQGSGMLTSVAMSDGLIVVPAGMGTIEPGTVLQAITW